MDIAPDQLRIRVGVAHVDELLDRALDHAEADLGVGHLAARTCPTLTLFGPTDPAIWHPVGRHVATLQGPRGRLEDLSLESALEALARVLGASSHRVR